MLLIASKGSIALDGVSLTINEVEGTRFGVNLIDHTRHATTLGAAVPGTEMNLEVDPLARYVARLNQGA
jgi:riboflavin synthase